jgi:ribosomal protein L7/L12
MNPTVCPHCGAPRKTTAPTCEFCEVVFPGETAPAKATGTPPGVVEALRRGNKIEAIRLWHKAKGCSLVEAKDAVEALEKTLRA